jgi:cytochrome d ubiquinol oxidase subunit I
MHGVNTFEHQPAKIAAIEGHYDTHAPAPLILFGVPDDDAEVTRYKVEIPYLGSLILTHSLDGEVKGLKAFPADQRPKAALIFWTFRVMVALGFAMLGLGLWAGCARWTGRLYDQRWLLRTALAMGPAGFFAVLCGWITTEVGRQPYTVYGHLTTADSVSPVAVAAVSSSLVAFIVVYFVVFGVGTFYILRLAGKPPEDGAPDAGRLDGPIRAASPPAVQADPDVVPAK